MEAERKAALKRELAVAEQARKDAEDEVTLELLARAYKGKPVPEDWDPETHPAFMQDPATQIEEGNAFAIGMDKLRQPDAPEEVAERAKQKGNHFLKRGPRYYKEAIKQCHCRAKHWNHSCEVMCITKPHSLGCKAHSHPDDEEMVSRYGIY